MFGLWLRTGERTVRLLLPIGTLSITRSIYLLIGTLPTLDQNGGTPHPHFIYLCCVNTLLCFKNAPADNTFVCQPSTVYSIYCRTGTYDDDVFLTLDTQYFQLNF